MMERELTRATRLSQDTQGAADVLLDSCAVCQMMETLHDRPTHGLSTEQGASSVSLPVAEWCWLVLSLVNSNNKILGIVFGFSQL